MDVDLDAVLLREAGMTAAEILMSESQERMLAIVDPGDIDAVFAITDKWDISASAIGTITEGGVLRVTHSGAEVASVPAMSLSDDAPRYERRQQRPADLDSTWADASTLPALIDLGALLHRLLDDPALGDRSSIYQQYDHMLFLQTVVEPGHDGSLIRIKGTEKGLAVSTDGDARRCFLDPRRGAERIVFESALNVAVTGARPYALVDNLNFGNPEKPEIMWQFAETVEGIAVACEALAVPVVGGNVSFYNETDGVDIYPTPVVGMLGFCDPMPADPPRLDRAEADMDVWLIGQEDGTDLAGSRVVGHHLGGRPAAIDFGVARRVVAHATRLADVVPVLHDVSAGGLIVAIAEICIRSGVGVRLEECDAALMLDEAPSRLVAVTPVGFDLGIDDVPTRHLGVIGGDWIDQGQSHLMSVAEATAVWRDAIPRRMGNRNNKI
jgi:phosphoribosylformylglycinamidine synthase